MPYPSEVNFLPITYLGNQALQLAEQAQRTRVQEKQMQATDQQMALQGVQIEQAKAGLRETQEKEKMANSGWDSNVEPIYADFPEEKKKQYIDMLKKGGLVNEQGIGTQRTRAMAIKMLESNMKIASDYFGVKLQMSREKVVGAYQNYQKAIEKGDPAKIAETKKIYESLSEENNILSGKIATSMKKIEVNEYITNRKPQLEELVKKYPLLAEKVAIAQEKGDLEGLEKTIDTLIQKTATPLKKSVRGLDRKTGQPVHEDEYGNLTFPNGKPYVGGPLDAITQKEFKPDTGSKLTMSDVKSAYSMEVNNVKSRMMIDMTPEEQANVSGQPAENILALLISGKIKSLSPEKKKAYFGELKRIESEYGALTNQVLGRKGATITPRMEPTASAPTSTKKLISDGKGGYRYE
jgi:hypothetical protein